MGGSKIFMFQFQLGFPNERTITKEESHRHLCILEKPLQLPPAMLPIKTTAQPLLQGCFILSIELRKNKKRVYTITFKSSQCSKLWYLCQDHGKFLDSTMICNDLDKGFMVNHNLARLAMIRTLGYYLKLGLEKSFDQKLRTNLKLFLDFTHK